MADKSPQPSITDPGLLSLLSSLGLGGNGGTAANTGASLSDVLQTTLMGVTGRQGLGGAPLTGIMPRWFKGNPALVQSLRQGQFDPYMPMPDVSSWQVYTPRPRVKITGSTNATVAEHAVETLDSKAGDATETVAAVKNQPFLWSEDQVAEAIKKFQDAGFTNVKDFDSVMSAWGGLVERAGAMYSLSSGKRKVTPWDVLDLYKTEMEKAGTSPTTVTQTSRSVSTITNGDGWNALRDTVSRMLGHDPSEEEVRDFVGRMNHLASANPTITTSTTSGIGTAHQTSTSHTKSGFDANDILENAYKDAQSDPDYAEFQSASTYYNAALSALGAIGG